MSFQIMYSKVSFVVSGLDRHVLGLIAVENKLTVLPGLVHGKKITVVVLREKFS